MTLVAWFSSNFLLNLEGPCPLVFGESDPPPFLAAALLLAIKVSPFIFLLFERATSPDHSSHAVCFFFLFLVSPCMKLRICFTPPSPESEGHALGPPHDLRQSLPPLLTRSGTLAFHS